MRPAARNTARKGTVVNDCFTHNTRSELTAALVNGDNYQYNYDNIGNRTAAVEDSSGVASRTEYTANELNQYTAVGDFAPTFDTDGNQTRIKTETGIWEVIYNAENRPVSFTNTESNTVVECAYDSMGRRAYKKVTSNGTVTLHQRYIYRGYLQIAALDLTRSNHPALWFITWDPTQPIATRPLAIQKDATWYTYGWDLTKNICELYGTSGYISTAYTYAPFGQVTATGSVTQPIQWSSEVWNSELGLEYYNWRYYNIKNARWLQKDKIESNSYNLYRYVENESNKVDILGLFSLFNLFSQNAPEQLTNLPYFTHPNKINCIGFAAGLNQALFPNYENSLKDVFDSLGWKCSNMTNDDCSCNCKTEYTIAVHVYMILPRNMGFQVCEEEEMRYLRNQKKELLDKGVDFWKDNWYNISVDKKYGITFLDYHGLRRNCNKEKGHVESWEYIEARYNKNDVRAKIRYTNNPKYFPDIQLLTSKCCKKPRN